MKTPRKQSGHSKARKRSDTLPAKILGRVRALREFQKQLKESERTLETPAGRIAFLAYLERFRDGWWLRMRQLYRIDPAVSWSLQKESLSRLGPEGLTHATLIQGIYATIEGALWVARAFQQQTSASFGDPSIPATAAAALVLRSSLLNRFIAGLQSSPCEKTREAAAIWTSAVAVSQTKMFPRLRKGLAAGDMKARWLTDAEANKALLRQISAAVVQAWGERKPGQRPFKGYRSFLNRAREILAAQAPPERKTKRESKPWEQLKTKWVLTPWEQTETNLFGDSDEEDKGLSHFRDGKAEDPKALLELEEEREALQPLDVRAGLSPKEREALALHKVQELTLEEIAHQWGVQRGTVAKLVARAVKKLRRAAGVG